MERGIEKIKKKYYLKGTGMPYIVPEKRKQMVEELNMLLRKMDDHPGTYNYAITYILHNLLRVKGKSYSTMNEIKGILNSVESEFDNSVYFPYEKRKKEENGSVSEFDRE